MTIAVTGASGQLGRLIVQKLKAQPGAGALVALARSPDKAADLEVEVREADYDRPDTLAPALAGIDTLVLVSGSEIGRRAIQHKAVIDAAKAAGVRWIVYTSLLHADRSTISLAGEHRATEDLLAASGIPYTLLRNGWYTENYAGGVAGALGHGALIGAAGAGRISSAAREDYAEAAVAVVTTPGQQGKIYELAGDTAWTLADLAAELSRQTGRDIPYQNLSEADYGAALAGAALAGAGLPPELADTIASWDTATAGGDLFDDGGQLSKLIGRPTTPLSATVGKLVS